VETSDHFKNGATPKSHTSRKIKIIIMKNVSLICFVIALISLSSCRKDYTCTCEKKVTATGSAIPTTVFSIKATKKRATEQCPNTGDVPTTETWTCTLK
jgi:hypothetical protein